MHELVITSRSRNLLFLLAALFIAAFAHAQHPSDTAEKPYIEVMGSAEKEVIPDEIYIAITIWEREESREKITVEEQEKELKSALISLKIPLSDLSLSDANADYVRVKFTRKEVISKSQYVLVVHDAESVAKVFEKLDELKIKDAYISKVSHSKIEEFKKEVKIAAIKAAKDKADYLLAAIGEKTGGALAVSENLEIPLYEKGISNRGYAINKTRDDLFYESYNASMDKKDDNIQFQKIKLTASIYVKFAIE